VPHCSIIGWSTPCSVRTEDVTIIAAFIPRPRFRISWIAEVIMALPKTISGSSPKARLQSLQTLVLCRDPGIEFAGCF
jgi:hypothetical protein